MRKYTKRQQQITCDSYNGAGKCNNCRRLGNIAMVYSVCPDDLKGLCEKCVAMAF